MKFTVPTIVFGLLQLSLPFAIATADERNLRRGDESDQEIVNEDLASEESDRELRPNGYQPGIIRRPGQSRKYGLNTLVGFRPYTNPNGFVAQPRQQPLTQPQQGGRAPPRAGGTKGGKSFKSAKALKGTKGVRQRSRMNPAFADGNVAVIGIQRNPNSLAQALGFFKVEPGTPVIIVDAEPATIATEEPTGTPAPTITPQPTITPRPTKQPTINPTKNPTNAPTNKPTSVPTINPTSNPTGIPTQKPTQVPTVPPPTPAPVVPVPA